MSKIRLSSVVFIYLFFGGVLYTESKASDLNGGKMEHVIQVGSKKLEVEIFGEDESVCEKFIESYDFSKKELKNPPVWKIIPEKRFSDSLIFFGLVYQMNLDANNDGLEDHILKAESPKYLMPGAIEVYITPPDFEINKSDMDLYKIRWCNTCGIKTRWGIGGKYWNKSLIADLYQAAAYDWLGEINPVIIDGVTYFYLANEHSVFYKKVYLIIKLSADKDVLNDKEVCHIEYD